MMVLGTYLSITKISFVPLKSAFNLLRHGLNGMWEKKKHSSFLTDLTSHSLEHN